MIEFIRVFRLWKSLITSKINCFLYKNIEILHSKVHHVIYSTKDQNIQVFFILNSGVQEPKMCKRNFHLQIQRRYNTFDACDSLKVNFWVIAASKLAVYVNSSNMLPYVVFYCVFTKIVDCDHWRNSIVNSVIFFEKFISALIYKVDIIEMVI